MAIRQALQAAGYNPFVMFVAFFTASKPEAPKEDIPFNPETRSVNKALREIDGLQHQTAILEEQLEALKEIKTGKYYPANDGASEFHTHYANDALVKAKTHLITMQNGLQEIDPDGSFKEDHQRMSEAIKDFITVRDEITPLMTALQPEKQLAAGQ